MAKRRSSATATLGKLTVRDRINLLLDAGSFHEIGALTGRGTYDESGELTALTPANFVMGRGRVDGRTIVVGGDDFTVRGGSADASIFQKQVHAERMAHDLGLPVVRLVDGSGGGGSVKTLETERRAFVPFNPGWEWVVANLSRVPVVSLCLGSVAGLGAARVVTSHYSLMVKETSHLFVAGPVIVNQLGVETVDKESLGGSNIHTRNGTVDDEVATEQEAFARARQFLSYLPSSVEELPPRAPVEDDPERREPTLIDAIPHERRRVYKVRTIIDAVVDLGSFLEIGRHWGRSAVTGLARLDGWPVAVLANDPYHYAGGWTADAARKVERFVDLAETFRLPVVHLVDNPGFLIGTAAEEAGTIRHGARALPRSTRRPCHGARCCSARSTGSRARPTRTRRASRIASPGRPASGDRCPSRAGSKRRTALSSKPRRIRSRSGPRSRLASRAPATRSRPRRPS